MSSPGLSIAQQDVSAVAREASSAELLLDKRPWLSPEVSFHAVGTRSALFDTGRQKLYAMNRSAAFMWCCLAEGYTPRQTVLAFAMQARVPSAEAERQFGLALEAWQSIGVAAADGAGGAARTSSFDANGIFVERLPAGNQPAPERSARPSGPDTVVCRALDTTVAVRFADGSLKAAVVPVLTGLTTDNRGGSDECLDVIHAYGGRVALIHGGAARWVGARSRLAPMVFAMLLRLGLERSGTFPAIQAAAVLGKRGTVLLPGPSGCGKSTLAAALMSHRHKVLCDDTVVLDMASMRVRPVAPVLCLKSGSWQAIERRLPRLRRQPGYQRPDGALVRFLALERPNAATRCTVQPHGFGVGAIVFPSYRPGRPTRLKPIGASAALNRLASCVDPIGHRLQAGDIEGLIRWVGRTDCYALSLDSLDDAATAVGDLLQ